MATRPSLGNALFLPFRHKLGGIGPHTDAPKQLTTQLLGSGFHPFVAPPARPATMYF